MYLSEEHHVSRHVPYKKLLKDEDDNPIGLLPQAFEMRKIDKGALSVNWLEYFGGTHYQNKIKVIEGFRRTRKSMGYSVGQNSGFGIGNVELLQVKCAENQHPKVRVQYEERRPGKTNPSHAKIIRLPNNDLMIMQILASDVFSDLVLNKDIP